MKKILLFFAALAASQLSQAVRPNCAVMNKIADKIADRNGDRYIPPLGKKVMKPGRLYFHTAPHSSCKMPSTFIIKGDDVIVYRHYNGYDSVMFIDKTGVTTEGWILAKDLRTTGTMGLTYH